MFSNSDFQEIELNILPNQRVKFNACGKKTCKSVKMWSRFLPLQFSCEKTLIRSTCWSCVCVCVCACVCERERDAWSLGPSSTGA